LSHRRADPLRAGDDHPTIRLSSLLTLVAPPLCPACGGHCDEGQALCSGCRADLRWLPGGPDVVAGVRLWAPLAYAGSGASLVRALKYRGALPLADAMAAHIAAGLPAELGGAAALVPVPMPFRRRRERGYNQAERLAAALGRRIGSPVVDCLERGGSAGPQVGRTREDRLRALGDVRVRRWVAPPSRVLLVDDVVTTGATLAGCARALRAAGVRSLAAVAYARTPGK